MGGRKTESRIPEIMEARKTKNMNRNENKRRKHENKAKTNRIGNSLTGEL